MQVVEEEEPLISTFSELISSDLKAPTVFFAWLSELHACTLKFFIILAYHYGFDPSYIRFHADTREVTTKLDSPLSETDLRADTTIRIPIGGLNGRTRRVQQSIAAYFRGHKKDEETKQLRPYSSCLLSRLSQGTLPA